MILYTLMPHELIFESDMNKLFEKQKEVTFDGIPLLVEMTDDNAYRIIRILSSDPAHFLDPRCTPGNKISFS